jgi:peptide/nickel transport system substrate-binding protein
LHSAEEETDVTRWGRTFGSALLALTVVLVLGACGSSSKSTSTGKSTSGGKAASGGMVTEVMGTAPDSLDPGMGYTSQALEPDVVSYTPMVTYAHASGTAGSALIPGLATALPKISADGKTYTMTMRKGLVYSNGTPVKASDFTYAIERAIKIPWGGSGSFLTTQIVGADAYSKGKATTISGITADDATGKITIHLIAPYGAFDNVLAFPSQAPIPSGTPMKNMPTSPPPGVGPYMITNIKPNVSFDVVRNPHWGAEAIPGIPTGHVDVRVQIQSNVNAGALSVLNGSADIFDWADVIPGSLLPQVQSQASGRFSKQTLNTTYYFFMNSKTKPFNNALARQAVIEGIDRNALVRLGSGFWTPACYFLPPGMVGHPTAPCPYGDPAATPNLAKAKALVQQSGMAGTPVTVWGEMRHPRKEFVDYYTSLLNQLGFKATEKIIADATYFPTIGNLKLNPQTGFADWNQDFPNPIDFYAPLLAGDAILPTNNENFSQVNDPVINAKVNNIGSLFKVPTSNLSSVNGQWQTLDQYVAKKAYEAVWGYLTAPEFTSSRINYSALTFHPVYGWDYTSFQLK